MSICKKTINPQTRNVKNSTNNKSVKKKPMRKKVASMQQIKSRVSNLTNESALLPNYHQQQIVLEDVSNQKPALLNYCPSTQKGK